MLGSRKHILDSHVESRLQERLFKKVEYQKYSIGKVLSNFLMFVVVSFVIAYTIWGFFN